MRIVVIKGYKKTGKTTTCTRLIEELVRRGYTVGSSKDIQFEGYQADQENTDSWRHAKAGASTVIVSGPKQTAVLYQHRREVRDLLDLFSEDIVVAEGDLGIPVANVVTGKTEEDLRRRRDDQTIAYSGVIANEMTQFEGLPVVSAMTDIGQLADLVLGNCTEL